MSDGPAVDARRAASTPWPILGAVGLAAAELGILTGSVPLATAGLVLLGGGLSGILTEAGYVGSAARSMIPVGALFLLLGGGLWTYRAPSLALAALATTPTVDGLARRGVALVVAGGLLLVLGAVVGRRSTARR